MRAISTHDYMKFFGFMGGSGESGEEYENRVRRSAKEKRRIENLRKRKLESKVR